MIFTETALPGAFIIELELFEDERGFFALSWSEEEFGRHGLNPRVVQTNLSFNNLRTDSPTFKRWTSAVLSAKNRQLLYVPEGFAHGFQTLEDNTEVSYQMSEVYAPESARGVRWNDPAFGIRWPETENVIINERDRTYSDFRA
jgi:dTDP-4-dehydrorhamnose 3,5-epimerase